MTPQEELLKIISQSLKEFEGVEHDKWTKKSDPAKWSKKEILGHLIDSATTNLRRFVITQYEQKQKIVYHQDEWVEMQNYQRADLREVIELWRMLNLQIVRVINSIPHDKLNNVCDTGKEGTEFHTLEFLIADYVDHLKHHLEQIRD